MKTKYIIAIALLCLLIAGSASASATDFPPDEAEIIGSQTAELVIGAYWNVDADSQRFIHTTVGGLQSSKFDIGDTVQVQNVGSSGLLILDAPCGNRIEGDHHRFDGDRGMIVGDSMYCCNYDRWHIRWSGDGERLVRRWFASR